PTRPRAASTSGSRRTGEGNHLLEQYLPVGRDSISPLGRALAHCAQILRRVGQRPPDRLFPGRVRISIRTASTKAALASPKGLTSSLDRRSLSPSSSCMAAATRTCSESNSGAEATNLNLAVAVLMA